MQKAPKPSPELEEQRKLALQQSKDEQERMERERKRRDRLRSAGLLGLSTFMRTGTAGRSLALPTSDGTRDVLGA